MKSNRPRLDNPRWASSTHFATAIMKQLLLHTLTWFCVCGQYVTAQDMVAPEQAGKQAGGDTINYWKLGSLGAATVGGFVVGHGLVNNLWWKGEFSTFHVNWEQDWTYALGADKVGHAYFPYAVGTVYGDLFRWCGMDSTTSIWYAAGLGLTYQTYVEIRDGFSKDYGFSWGDMGADVIGAAFPVVKHYVPALRPLEMQISFWPSQAFRDGAYGAIIDDYTSTTHWLSIGVHDYLPSAWQQWYPAWLNLAVGHSVEGLDGKGGGRHVLYLSLDWNLQRIPGLPPWLQQVFRTLHLYHLPAPAVRIAPSVAWFGLRW